MDARTWRAGMDPADAQHIDERLCSRLDAMEPAVRATALLQLTRALNAGVVDPATLHVIAECVAA